MIQNRTAQLIFQSFFCGIGLIGVLGSVGLFEMNFMWDFYIYFTNISNYLCIGLMIAELIQTAKKSGNSYVTVSPLLKFISCLGIVLTFLIFNIILAGEATRDPATNYSARSITLHIILPILYVLDWILFYEHKKIRWNWPFISVLFPFFYMIYVIIHAVILRFDTSITNIGGTAPLIYPYFFLNIEKIGLLGVGKWIIYIGLGFILLGYIFYFIDRLLAKMKNK